MTTQNSIDYDDNNIPSNLITSENKGLETIGQTLWDSYRIRASLVVQNPTNLTYDEALARRAKRYASLDVSRAIEQYDIGAKIYASSERKDSHYNSNELAGYALLSIYASKQIDKDWTARVKLENALDKDYQLAYGYNTPGRTVTATLVYQPH